MKQLSLVWLFSLVFLCSFFVPTEMMALPTSTITKTKVVEGTGQSIAKISKKQQRAQRKTIKSQVKNLFKKAKKSKKARVGILLILLTILLPPLGMAIFDNGLSGRFWLSLLLTIIGYLPGLIYTLIKISKG